MSIPDPRPQVVVDLEGRHVVQGHRCVDCAYPSVLPGPWCARCRGEMRDEMFGPRGTVWSSTVVHVPLPGRTPPYALAYVDLEDGPRLLAHVKGTVAVVPPGTAVEVSGVGGEGDPEVRVV